MRHEDFDAGLLRLLDLRSEHGGIGATEHIDSVELVVNRVLHALDPLGRAGLVLPLHDLKTEVLRRRDHRQRDVLGEWIGARHWYGEDLLAGHYLPGIKRLAWRHEGGQRAVSVDHCLGCRKIARSASRWREPGGNKAKDDGAGANGHASMHFSFSSLPFDTTALLAGWRAAGGRRRCQSVSCCQALPARIRTTSFHQAASSSAPIGRPARVRPQGSDRPGLPAKPPP